MKIKIAFPLEKETEERKGGILFFNKSIVTSEGWGFQSLVLHLKRPGKANERRIVER